MFKKKLAFLTKLLHIYNECFSCVSPLAFCTRQPTESPRCGMNIGTVLQGLYLLLQLLLHS